MGTFIQEKLWPGACGLLTGVQLMLIVANWTFMFLPWWAILFPLELFGLFILLLVIELSFESIVEYIKEKLF